MMRQRAFDGELPHTNSDDLLLNREEKKKEMSGGLKRLIPLANYSANPMFQEELDQTRTAAAYAVASA